MNQTDGPMENEGRLMRWYVMLIIALQGIWSFRLQQILVLLTMAIGSFGLAATLFLGEGALKNLWSDLDQLMGSRMLIYASPGPGDNILVKRPFMNLNQLDLEALQKQVVGAKYITPIIFARDSFTFRGVRGVARIDGISKPMEDEQAYKPTVGELFSDANRSGKVMECFVTASLAKRLNIDPVERPMIALGTYPARIVGIIPDPPEAGEHMKERLAVSYRWAKLLWGTGDDIGVIAVSWATPEKMESVVHQVRKILDTVRAPGAYQLTSSKFAVKKRKEIVANIMAAGSAQSLFSIIIASIGVLNVMLANVTQRSREFAIRVSVGADPNDLALIVLVESIALSLAGAVIGLITAIVAAPVITSLVASRLAEAAALEPVISFSGVTIPIVVCALCGAFAGVIPAIRARRVDVLSLLRAE